MIDIIDVGDEVNITLVTGQRIQGIIESWDAERAIIGYPDNTNKTIILNPNKNVVMLGVFGLKEEPINEKPDQATPEEKIVIVEPDIKPEYHGHDQDMRLASLVDLRKQKKQAVKAQLSHLFKNKTPRQNLGVKYDTPDFSK